MVGRRAGLGFGASSGRVRLGPVVLLTALAAGPAQAATFTVGSTGDQADNNVGNGTCSIGPPTNACTLRAALQEANFTAAADIINFNIGGGGAQTITPGSALPTISQRVTINATTQPGFAGAPLIEIVGPGGGAAAGLTLSGAASSSSVIRGLVIRGFTTGAGDAIRILAGSNSNVIAGNYLGTDLTGALARPNNVGVFVQASSNNQIGGTLAADRNVISGNGVDGIQLTGAGTNANLVQGNYIGVDVTGAVDLGNGSQGVAVFTNVTGTTIGGAGAGNVISGNNGHGIAISNVSTGTTVQANLIGTNAAGTGAVGNSIHGMNLDTSAANTTITGNTIAFNGANGVWLGSMVGTGNGILGNAIYSNGAIGIELNADGVSANDTGDGDAGPNNMQNFPVLSAAMTNGAGSANFAGSLNGAATTTYRVELFASAAADPTGFGEGRRFLDFTNVTTNAAGNAVIGATLATALSAGEFVTATATDPANNTSEFSAAIVAVGHLVVTTTADTVDGTTTSVANLIATPGADGRISLREAIVATNATAGADTVTFGIPLTDVNHLYYRDDAVGTSLTNIQPTTLADTATPSSPAITDFDADYPAGFARGWYRIQPNPELPFVSDAVLIDAATQPGYVSGGPVVELDGTNAGFNGRGLIVTSSPVTLRGFIFNRFGKEGITSGGASTVVQGCYVGTDASGTLPLADGIGAGGAEVYLGGNGSQLGGLTLAARNVVAARVWIDADNVVVQGNFIGTDVTGTASLGVNYSGITLQPVVSPTVSNVTIGGLAGGSRNVISGSLQDGISLSGAGTHDNTIQGNYIGTNAAGTASLGNGQHGIRIASGSANNTIGGTSVAARNVLSGNLGQGVRIDGAGTSNNVVAGNFIGTNALGTAGIPNNSGGIAITNSAANDVIGGSAVGAGNRIAYNLGGDGINVAAAAGTGNSILRNEIFGNAGLGIDLLNNGVTANDALDVDIGPNDLLNFPAIMGVYESVGTLLVPFGLDVPAGSYRIEFFKNPSGADPTGSGEGEVFVSSRNLTHPGGGARVFSHYFPGSAGDVVTATATACTDGATCSTFGSTSELGDAVTAVTTAVKLMSFTATARDRAVDLQWQTGSELDNLGFHLHRSLSSSGPWARLTSTLIPGLGSSPIGRSYSFRDSGLTNGTRYYYRLEDVDTASRATSHGPISAIPTPQDPAEGKEAGGKAKGAARSCPEWVVAAYGSAAGSASSVVPSCTRHGDPEAVSLSVVSRDSRQATLDLKTGGFYALHEASGKVRVFVRGFDFPQDPQAPALPSRRALVDAVVGRRVELAGVRAMDQVGFPGLVPTALGEAEMQVSQDGTVRAGRRARPGREPRHVSTDLAHLLPSVFQGEAKSAVVVLTPLRYDSRRRQIVLSKRVLVRLLFTGRETGESGRGRFGRAARPLKPVAGELLARLYTTSRGLHAVAFDQLFSARGRSLAISELRLERQGQAQGIHIEPPGDRFGPGSVLYFYADTSAASTNFSSETAWELLRAQGLVLMPLVAAAPSGDTVTTASTGHASFEINRFYQPGLLEAPDPWLWDALASGTTRAERFSLAGVSPATAAAALDVFLQGASESGSAVDHHVSVSLNGTLVGEAQFAGKKPYRMSFSVSPSLLLEGANELSLANVADTGVSSSVFLDRFSLAYPQVASLASGAFEGTWNEAGTATVSATSGPVALLDVTSAASWLTGYQSAGGLLRFRAEAGHRYLAVSQQALLTPRVATPTPSTLRNTQNQADYLLIAPRAFLTAAEPLLQRRRDQGLNARAVAFEQIADEFGHGQPSAEAVKSYLAFAFQSWARPSPRYVLLLGDSSYDPRNFSGRSLPSPLPALWTRTSYLWTVSDPELAAVNGDDELPDLAIGRLPATTVEQAETLVSKLIAWEDSGQGLQGPAALVADNPDPAGDFEANVRDIAQSYMSGRNPQLLLLSELGPELRPRIQDALNGGLSYLAYVGHGGAAVWASENVWNSWDAPSLQAQSRQPLLVTLDCLNGYFVAPSYESLAESLVKAEGRGAIASFSPSGLSLDSPAHQYHRALIAELTSGRHQRLGDAVLAAQKAYAQTGLMPELLSIYHLFGDPATRIETTR